MMMMLTQDEIDSLLSSLSVSPATTAVPAVNTITGLATNNMAGNSTNSNIVNTNIADLLSQEKEKNYKIYNFKRPDKFSKDHLRALETIHEQFARQVGLLFSAFLRLSVDVDVVSVDQLTYDEFTRSMPRPITVGVIDFKPLPQQPLIGLSHEITMCILDRMLGGKGLTNAKPRELTDVENSLMRRTITRVLDLLSTAWSGVIPNNKVTLKGMEESYNNLQIALPSEIVAVLTFEVTLANRDSGLMSICFPYPMLEGIIDQLSSQHLFQQNLQANPLEEAENHLALLDRMNYAPIPVSVRLGGVAVSVRDLLHIKPNDVIRLNRSAGSNLLLCLNEAPKYYVQPGVCKNKLAVCIMEPTLEPQEIKGFGLEESW
jgi:flagellar motor switch protein FliM